MEARLSKTSFFFSAANEFWIAGACESMTPFSGGGGWGISSVLGEAASMMTAGGGGGDCIDIGRSEREKRGTWLGTGDWTDGGRGGTGGSSGSGVEAIGTADAEIDRDKE